MTALEFNAKYINYIENGFGGLEFDIVTVTEYLDKRFEDFIKFPGFSYAQIKLKFGRARFYAEGIDTATCYEVERDIDALVKQSEPNQSDIINIIRIKHDKK